MAQDPGEIVVGIDGDLYTAPLATAAPADIDAAIPVGWTNVGLLTEDGGTFRDAKTREKIASWQLKNARQYVNDRDIAFTFAMRQWSKGNLSLALGGGEVTGSLGKFRFEPPDTGDSDERAFLLHWVDGAKKYRLVFPRGETSEPFETQVRRQALDLPVGLHIIEDTGVKPYYLLTNDPAFDPAP